MVRTCRLELVTVVGALAAALPLVVMAAVFRVLVVGGRVHPFSARLGRVEMRTASGSNAATVLAVLTIAHLLQAAQNANAASRQQIAPALIIGGITLLLGLVLIPRFARTVLALAGVAAFLADLLMTQGAPATASYMVIAFGCWLGLAVLRGFFG